MVKIQQLDNMSWICDEKKEGRKDGKALFNDAHNTFYLWLYGVWYTVRCFWLCQSKYSSLTTCCCEFVNKKEGRKEGRKVGRKEGKALFKDALNTIYLWLYGVWYTEKDHGYWSKYSSFNNTLFWICDEHIPCICYSPKSYYGHLWDFIWW